jgi:hypothetical protein
MLQLHQAETVNILVYFHNYKMPENNTDEEIIKNYKTLRPNILLLTPDNLW